MSEFDKKVVFLTPPVSLKQRYGNLAGAGSSMPALGVLTLAAAVRSKGFYPFVVEASALGLSYEDTIRTIAEISPRYVGISSTTLTIFPAAKLARLTKELDPGITVIIGGPHLTAVPQETMERFPPFDIGVIGEGEETTIELLNALADNRDLSDVKGIIFRPSVCNPSTEPNRSTITPGREFIQNLDNYPFPAWDLLPEFPKAYKPPPFKVKNSPAISIVTSRGCPYQCTFCDTSVFGKRFRAYSAEYITAMIEELYYKYGVKEFIVEDDTFLVSKKRAFDICESILKAGLKISWSCNSRVDLVDRDILAMMKKAGCWYIGFGIESGNQAILDLEKKNITLEQAEKAVKLTREAGILAKGFFMVGHPRETQHSLQETIDFAKRSNLSDIAVTALTPLPGSQIYCVADRYGAFDHDWRKMNLLNIVFVPVGLTKGLLSKYRKRMLREFYLRPQIICSYFNRIIRNPRLVSTVTKGAAAFLKTVFATEE
jgi:radical SAM superfamily enzyme YgiQ (UPF0313 family)